MYKVIHEPEQQRFIVHTAGGQSLLSYRLSDSAIDFDHTFVCPSDRGSKVGVSLVQAGVTWARAQGFAIQASCWYVARYLEKHPA